MNSKFKELLLSLKQVHLLANLKQHKKKLSQSSQIKLMKLQINK